MNRKSLVVALMGSSLLLGSAASAQDNASNWNLSDLYPSVEAWEAEKEMLSKGIAGIAACKGRLASSAVVLRQCLASYFDVSKRFSRFFSYAAMNSDQDVRDQDAMARRQSASLLATQFTQAAAFAEPELLRAGEARVRELMDADPGMAPYRHYLDNVLRTGAHTLSEEAEEVIAATGDIQRVAANTYSTLANADIPWPTVTLSDGSEARLDTSGYSRSRSSANRADRKLVFDEFWGAWGKWERTMGTTLGGSVNGDNFRATVRKYPNALAASIDGPNIPEEVYRTLVTETNDNLDTLHRYLRLRGRMLGVDDLRYYDIYPPIVALDKKFPIDKANELMLASMAPLGEEYVAVVKRGLDERWMDTYPREGKRSGAYMNGSAYDVHPYLLLNFNEDYESLSTLTHEWGHALHSWLANKAQPYPTAGYSTFTAEIASTFNEALLLDYMLGIAGNDDERLYYLGSALEAIRGTFFRQTMFAEFELKIHEAVERGEPLTGQKLSDIYATLLRRYHGHDAGVMQIDDAYTIEWAFVPHFYRNFYVFQYATSLAAASLLAQDVLGGREGALESYMNLLRAGGSDYPYDLLVRAGVDLAEPEPYRATFDRMNTIMDQIEAILDSRG